MLSGQLTGLGKFASKLLSVVVFALVNVVLVLADRAQVSGSGHLGKALTCGYSLRAERRLFGCLDGLDGIGQREGELSGFCGVESEDKTTAPYPDGAH